MAGHLAEGAVEVGLVATGAGDDGLRVVGGDDMRGRPEEGACTYVPGYPAGELLRGEGLRVGVAGEAHGCHEERGLRDLAPFRVHYAQLLPREVGVHPLSCPVHLAHGYIQAVPESAVEPGQLRVGVMVLGVLLRVLFPEKRQRHPFSGKLPVQVGHVRQRA